MTASEHGDAFPFYHSGYDEAVASIIEVSCSILDRFGKVSDTFIEVEPGVRVPAKIREVSWLIGSMLDGPRLVWLGTV